MPRPRWNNPVGHEAATPRGHGVLDGGGEQGIGLGIVAEEMRRAR